MDPSKRGQNQEYLLQGSILDESVELLIQKLKGMCDSSEESLIKFKDHVMVYSMREQNGSTVNLRINKHLSSPNQPYLLSYLGQPEVGDKNRLTSVRTCVEVNCTHSICSFIQELGFTLDYELISQGWLFYKNKLRVRVSKICKTDLPNQEICMPLTKSHLIEVSIISSAGNDQAPTEVHAFSDSLKPLVNLEKFDPRSIALIRH